MDKKYTFVVTPSTNQTSIQVKHIETNRTLQVDIGTNEWNVQLSDGSFVYFDTKGQAVGAAIQSLIEVKENVQYDTYFIINPEQHTKTCLEYAKKTQRNYCIAECKDWRDATRNNQQ